MYIPRDFKLLHLFLVILESLVFLTIIPSIVYGDDWVYVESYEDFTLFYKLVKIDKQNYIIKVWDKRVYTHQGKIDFMKKFDSINKQKYIDINYSLGLILMDYNNWKFSIIHITHYSKSGNVLDSFDIPSKWEENIPDSKGDYLLNKILKDYNIQR